MTKRQKGHNCPKPKIQDAIKVIEASNFRLTRPRKLLLEAIFEQKSPFSAPGLEKLFSRTSKRNACDPVTIYRTLPVFEELGIIEKCDFSEDRAHYEVAPHLGQDVGHKHHHHHLICRSCNRIESLDFCGVEGQENLLKKLGYTKISHRLEFSGLCPACSR